ncbi:MAG TPA: hypothetical protein VG309_12415 [Rhizomicrobium sp.]|jgi:hypothetical protein|nr:hypothetical protein [Rhizomicrobium sp.]
MAALTIRTGVPMRRLLYQTQNSHQTLSEGLAEYYRSNGERVLPPSSLAPESAALFRSHDICHVIFGLDTTLADEAMADTRIMFSCDVGAARYAQYLATNKDARTIFKEVGYGAALLATVKTFPRLLRAFVESKRQKNKWPWIPPKDFEQRTLAELRFEYGIRVV